MRRCRQMTRRGSKERATESSVLVNFSVRNEAVTPGPSPHKYTRDISLTTTTTTILLSGITMKTRTMEAKVIILAVAPDGRTSRNACTGIDVVFGLHCCGGLSEAAVALAIRHAAAFAICTCCFRSHPHCRFPAHQSGLKHLPFPRHPRCSPPALWSAW